MSSTASSAAELEELQRENARLRAERTPYTTASSKTRVELDRMEAENERLRAGIGAAAPPFSTASSKTRMELERMQAENERLRAERAAPTPPSESSTIRLELERIQAENECLRARRAAAAQPPPSASSKTHTELERMQAENERSRAERAVPPPPSASSKTRVELERMQAENECLRAERAVPPPPSASSKTRVELERMQAENERLRAERAAPPPPSASSKTHAELERMQAENERLRAQRAAPPPPSASSKTRVELERMQAENKRLQGERNAPRPPSASSKTHAELERMQAENERLQAGGGAAAPPPPSASSKTRAELERMQAENERLRAERAGPPPPSAGSKTRAELERVQAENARLIGKRDSAAVELEVRKIKDGRMKENAKLQAKIEHLFIDATSVDVAFLVDCTSSMQSSIENVKEQVINMALDWQSRLNSCTRAAFVGYRDYGNQLDCRDFTTNMHDFKDWVGKLRASGGGDTAEDVFSGLEQAAKLSWKKGDGAKLVFIIADAPCHGTNFHEGVSDDHPGGDKHRRSVMTLLRGLQAVGVQMCNFSHLNSSTKKMVREFKRLIGDDGHNLEAWMTEDEMSQGDTAALRERLFHRVSETISRSIAASFSTHDPHRAAAEKGKVEIDKTPNYSINWNSVPQYEGHRIKQVLPKSLFHLLEGIDDGEDLLTDVDRGNYKICSKPFDDGGATRLPFHAFRTGGPGRKEERYYVAKIFRSRNKEANTLSKYKQQAEVQAVAAFMALEFNRAKARAGINSVPDIKYIMATTLCVATEGGRESNFNIERWLQGGDIVKFNSNYGYVNHRAYADLVQAFSHWTWHASKRKLMVVDVQGVWDEGRKQYTLFDPCVHCVDTIRFQASTFTNMGQRGFDKFFLSHRCNDFCKRLRLPKHRMQFHGDSAHEEAASYRSV